MYSPSRCIHSNQYSVHLNLEKTLERHSAHPYLKPITQHTLKAFGTIDEFIKAHERPVILDSGCGSGHSSAYFAERNPDCIVIGIDKSSHRLAKGMARFGHVKNLKLARADLFDFWRLASSASWNVIQNYLLYPNPWPLKKDMKKRYYGHPAFFHLAALGRVIEVRSNWKLYLEEFALAFDFVSGRRFPVSEIKPAEPISLFEKKYALSDHRLYRLVVENK
jgi:tRNA (guanine-N7-)-methyltransferase